MSTTTTMSDLIDRDWEKALDRELPWFRQAFDDAAMELLERWPRVTITHLWVGNDVWEAGFKKPYKGLPVLPGAPAPDVIIMVAGLSEQAPRVKVVAPSPPEPRA
jgi:hypothetical protein